MEKLHTWGQGQRHASMDIFIGATLGLIEIKGTERGWTIFC